MLSFSLLEISDYGGEEREGGKEEEEIIRG